MATFIQTKVGAPQGGGNGQQRPPPPPHHGQGGARPQAQVITVNPGPNGNHQGMQPMMPPPPNREMVPVHLQQIPLAQISDIRRERMTDTEARDELAEYIIIRIEKVGDEWTYTDEGEISKPTWAQVIRREVRDISKPEAIQQIRRLGRDKSLGEKKRKLTPAQQSQLERAQDELQRREWDQRFQIKLVQLDHQTRHKRERRASSYYKDSHRGTRYHDTSYHGGSSWSKSHRKNSQSNRRSQGSLVDLIKNSRRPSLPRDGKSLRETVSITAYYKRCLKPEVDAHIALMQRDAEMQRRLQPPNPHQVFPPQQQMHPQGAPGQGKPGAGQGGPQAGGGGKPGNGPVKGFNGPKPPPGVQMKGGKPGKPGEKKYPGPRSKSPYSSGSSYSGSSDSDGGSFTTPTSSESSRGRRRSASKNRLGPRKEPRYLEGPRHYGIATNIPPHKVRQHSVHRISDEFLPGAPLPQQATRVVPVRPPVNIEQIKADAYALGRADERLDTRDHVERVTELALSRNPPPLPPVPTAPAPAFLQRRPSVRVHADDGAYRLDDEVLDRFKHLHFEDDRWGRRVEEPHYDPRHEPRYADSLADAIADRQAYENSLRREREEILDWEEEEMERERERGRRPSAYVRRRDSAPNGHLFGANPNPFSPHPAMRRRATMGPAFFED